MTIDDYIEQRNEIQLKAENISKNVADKCWIELGVANRHIERVLNGDLRLAVVEREINGCFQRAKKLL